MIISGTILFAFCLFMLSLSHPQNYYQVFLSQGLGLGIAMGMTYIPTMGVIAHHFQRRRTIALGIVASGTSVGGIVHPIMLNNLFHGPTGFANGVRASAGLNLALMGLASLLMRTKLRPKPSAPLWPILKRSSKDIPFVLAVTGATLVIIGLYVPIFFLQLYAIGHGVNPALAFYTLTILNAANAFGRIVPNWAAHYVGVYKMIVPCTAVTGGLIYVFLVTRDGPSIIIFAIFFGFFSGVYISLLVPMLAQIGRNMSELGTRMGICFTLTGVGSFIGTPIAGALLTRDFIWWRPIVFAGTMIICGAATLALSGVIWVRKVSTSRK
ncbi:MFS general substrate transporter [Fomitiporia mediterranea MF3/22]|uniref:MFS general substrate transporter n=1 Tax=Fomitiporia mediterranea (strain MF3/22) TaxID=694068 RepID=UPI000440970B|nr:MFS general substrate transporter [Fomitiporia mediterranea MF3/22]EJD00252.1 MFS general substrate transporter [Fomitiporia mediterranea MF3/22]